MILFCDTEQWQRAIASIWPHSHMFKQLILYSIFNVLEDFAQLQDSVSVLSTFKIG